MPAGYMQQIKGMPCIGQDRLSPTKILLELMEMIQKGLGQIILCVTESMKTYRVKPTNYEKKKAVTQGKEGNLAVF